MRNITIYGFIIGWVIPDLVRGFVPLYSEIVILLLVIWGLINAYKEYINV